MTTHHHPGVVATTLALVLAFLFIGGATVLLIDLARYARGARTWILRRLRSRRNGGKP